ncbi:acyl carrier protein [Kitasatospora sp. NPDC058170]|uniref:acyl carrier protein n=1 Tax=Kitasatospora sp. NPDC058170 TaxID=3346364 RepID=UPI0036DA1CC6
MGELLGVDPQEIPLDRPLGELGIDSLTAAQLSVEVEERAGLTIPLERFLGDETIGQLLAQAGESAA